MFIKLGTGHIDPVMISREEVEQPNYYRTSKNDRRVELSEFQSWSHVEVSQCDENFNHPISKEMQQGQFGDQKQQENQDWGLNQATNSKFYALSSAHVRCHGREADFTNWNGTFLG